MLKKKMPINHCARCRILTHSQCDWSFKGRAQHMVEKRPETQELNYSFELVTCDANKNTHQLWCWGSHGCAYNDIYKFIATERQEVRAYNAEELMHRMCESVVAIATNEFNNTSNNCFYAVTRNNIICSKYP